MYNNDIVVRKAEQEDADGLHVLMVELMGRDCDRVALEQQLGCILRNPDYALFVACEGGELVGTVMGVACYDPGFNGKRFGIIENVVVAPTARGKGVGRKLFDAVEAWAEDEMNCAYIQLVSGTQRTGAHVFYERIGYARAMGFRKIF